MPIVVVILEAIAALVGPAADMLKSMFTASKDFHAKSDVTPDELAAEAIQVAEQAVAVTNDVFEQIHRVRAALSMSHSDLPPTIATMHAAAAVEHVTNQAS